MRSTCLKEFASSGPVVKPMNFEHFSTVFFFFSLFFFFRLAANSFYSFLSKHFIALTWNFKSTVVIFSLKPNRTFHRTIWTVGLVESCDGVRIATVLQLAAPVGLLVDVERFHNSAQSSPELVGLNSFQVGRSSAVVLRLQSLILQSSSTLVQPSHVPQAETW